MWRSGERRVGGVGEGEEGSPPECAGPLPAVHPPPPRCVCRRRCGCCVHRGVLTTFRCPLSPCCLVATRRQLHRQCDDWWYSSVMTGVVCPDQLRDNQRLGLGLFSNPLSVRFGGWHMSYFMSIDKIVEKLESISHIERCGGVASAVTRVSGVGGA